MKLFQFVLIECLLIQNVVVTYLLFPDESLNDKVFDNRHEKMNAEWYSNTFKIFFLKCVHLRQYLSPNFGLFFQFSRKVEKKP